MAAKTQTEQRAAVYARKVLDLIHRQKGAFLKDENGSLHLILDGRRIPLKINFDNLPLADVMISACGVTTTDRAAQAALQRVCVQASKQVGEMVFRRFSGTSKDRTRLYIPVQDGRLVLVSAQGLELVKNGHNEDQLWIEHPRHAPLAYCQQDDPSCGLQLFEELLVETQACAVPPMKWLVAMNAGLFPFVRDLCPARFIQVHRGATQQGKTSGAQRFTLLHGLGEVTADFSVAALGDIGDIGLLAMDNKEGVNFSPAYTDYCLILSTGGARGRSSPDGTVRTSRYRPVGIITTIEGVAKPELQARCLVVEYAVNGRYLRRAALEQQIQTERHKIGSAMVSVLQRFMALRQTSDDEMPNPIPQCEEHFSTVCSLLVAYEQVAGKPAGWAKSIVDEWAQNLGEETEDEEELEQPILRALQESGTYEVDIIENFEYRGAKGTLYLTTCAQLLTLLQRLRLPNTSSLPRNPSGLSRRLRSGKFQQFVFLDWESPGTPLKRSGAKKPIGILVHQ